VIRLTAVISLEDDRRQALTYESSEQAFIMGRDESSDFQLPVSTISRQHARIFETDGVYLIEDLGSTHGTVVNGNSLGKGDKVILRDGDIIELTRAKITCAIEVDDFDKPDPMEATQAIAARAVQGILGRLQSGDDSGPYFRILSGVDEGKRLMLGSPITEWYMGRAQECELMLNDRNVSRKHALVKKDWNGYTIEDLGSRNGVIVKGNPISRPRRLQDRDEIVIGPIKLLYIDPNADLMDALKDVPGFDFDEPEEAEEDASHFGAPGDEEGADDPEGPEPEDAQAGGLDAADDEPDGEPDEAGFVPDALPEPEVPMMEAVDPAHDHLGDIGEIDPELLDEEGKGKTEWLILFGGGALVIASLLLLFALFA
jgi:pSer/pThr/pTyr-binding forkhead associated (FHA) protein